MARQIRDEERIEALEAERNIWKRRASTPVLSGPSGRTVVVMPALLDPTPEEIDAEIERVRGSR